MPLPECRKFNSFVGMVFGVIFRSDRRSCIERIREVGPEAIAAELLKTDSSNTQEQKN